jgi:hypothetical protein
LNVVSKDNQVKTYDFLVPHNVQECIER